MYYHPDMKVSNENVKDVLRHYTQITKEQKVVTPAVNPVDINLGDFNYAA